MLQLKARRVIDAELMTYSEYLEKYYGDPTPYENGDREGVCLLYKNANNEVAFTEWLPKTLCEEIYECVD